MKRIIILAVATVLSLSSCSKEEGFNPDLVTMNSQIRVHPDGDLVIDVSLINSNPRENNVFLHVNYSYNGEIYSHTTSTFDLTDRTSITEQTGVQFTGDRDYKILAVLLILENGNQYDCEDLGTCINQKY